jgi:taurine dioxygenase
MAQFAVKPLDPALPFGIRISDLTRDMLGDAETRDSINGLFVEHGMIVFEGVEQSDEMQLAISSCFGPLKEHPVKGVSRVDGSRLPGVIEIRSEPGRGVVEVDGRTVSHWLPWHFDHCYNDELNLAGVLRPVDRVEEGGITGFLDGVALYKAFPEELRARIEGAEVVYALNTQYDDLKFGRPKEYRMVEPKPMPPSFAEQRAAMSRAIHPAVWTHKTGEKCLHVSSYMAEGLVGHEDAEGDALLEEVCQTIVALADGCSYHHKWGPDDMAIWDNTRMLHCVNGCAPELSRLMYRTTIAGDYKLGRWEKQGATDKALEAAM